MIHLVGMAKGYLPEGGPPKIVLQPTTLAMPADRRVALLGERGAGKTVFMKLLAGTERPTHGALISRVRRSPLIRAGALFHPRMTGMENIRFYARTMNLDADQLMAGISAFCGVALGEPGAERAFDSQLKASEIGFLTLLPFDCYLIDEIGHLPELTREQHLDVLAQRQAGVIFSTNHSSLARRYADCAMVIRDGVVHPFSSVEEAIKFHDR